MKSTFYGAILALALSVSAAPVARNSTSSHSSPSHGGHTDDDHFGPPMFFGDEGSDQEPAGSKDPGSSPSANRHHGPWNATTTGTNPILSTGTSTPDINKRSIPSDHEDDHFGPPMFFGDEGSDQEPPGSRDPGSSPSASRHHGHHGNWNATNTDPNPALSTGTSTPDIVNKRNLPSRVVTPNVKSFVSKDGHTMYGMQNAVCSDVTLIFARGTTEKGNMGTCIGPGLAEHLRDEIPSLSVQGVDYPANSKGNTHYGASGGPYMAMLAREARKQCPDTKIVLAGYSQGARVIHGALGHVDEPIDASDVAAVVAFGDPLNGKDELEGVDDDDLLQVCATEDHRCQKGRVDMKPDGGHISYGQSAEDVAKWIKKTVGK